MAALLHAYAAAAQIGMTVDTQSGETNRLIVFSALADDPVAAANAQEQPDAVMLAIDAQI